MNIILKSNTAKKWGNFSKSYVKGFAFYMDTLLNEEMLYEHIINAINENTLSAILLKLNGNFSMVITHKNLTYLISDKIKTYPLLYTKEANNWIITDEAEVILNEKKEISLNETNTIKFLSITYLDEDKTLLNNVYIVKAGNYVILNKYSTAAQTIEYHKYIYPKNNLTEEEIIKDAASVADKAFDRIFRTIGEKRIVIPLSGGYDSRWIACMCKKFNITNVICYTYGLKDSFEIQTSKKIAETLGFKWYFVEYTEKKWEIFLNDPQTKQYILSSSCLNTVTHLQDFMAIKELYNNNIISAEDIIIPGHSADALGGSHIAFDLLNKNYSVAKLIFKKNGNNAIKKKYLDTILYSFNNNLFYTNTKTDTDITCDLSDNWNFKSRQANFIVNSVRVYDHFNIDWRLPFWDDDLVEFWMSIKWDYKQNQSLYDKFLFTSYFNLYDVAIKKDISQEENKSATSKMLSLIPAKLKYGIKKVLLNTRLIHNFIGDRSDINGCKTYRLVLKNCDTKIQRKYMKRCYYCCNTVMSIYLVNLIRNKYQKKILNSTATK